MTATKEKPEGLTQEHLEYLDELRASGETNMFGAPAYLTQEFGLAKRDAIAFTGYWMDTFSGRQL